MNDLDLCLEVVSRSGQPLRHIHHCIDKSLVPTNRQQEMAYGESNCHLTDDVTWPWKVKFVSPSPISLEPNILKTAGDAT